MVIDASATAPLLLPDEFDQLAPPVADAIRDGDVSVPWVWWFEVRNLLLRNERRGRITRQDADKAIAALNALHIDIDHVPHGRDILDLARQHGLTAYDAAYLELSRRHAIPLATLDKELAAAAAAEGVRLVGR